jgi:bifunctional UDP-N-acetylglucosamine pyrophosphorylase/glucosamine-1-phosphate N-acetyltransferase
MTDNPTSAPDLEVVVLAAGQGTRMRSARPKVLHELGGRPILGHVLDTVAMLQPSHVHVVVGHQGERVKAELDRSVTWVSQSEQLGTGHAVVQALPGIRDTSTVLVVYGDVPLVSAETLARACEVAARGEFALVTATFDDPAELGRIVRSPAGAIEAIVEYADASETQRDIREINSGILALDAATMKRLLADVETRNAQGEYYLTDLIELAVASCITVTGIPVEDPTDVAGINDRSQLAELERIYQSRAAQALMAQGVTLADPKRLDIRGDVEVGEDTFIDVNVVLEGSVRLGRDVTVGSGCVIRNSELGDGVVVEPHTVIEGAQIDGGCQLGPFARIRPGTELGEGVKIGNFVELKKARLGRGSKASHLTYLGDSTIGEGCNIGAGTVTCNYDGIDKHRTEIGDRVFVGTNTTLVAPLKVGDDAYVAAGSTITTLVPEGELGVGRGRQRNIKGWTRPDRRKKSES